MGVFAALTWIHFRPNQDFCFDFSGCEPWSRAEEEEEVENGEDGNADNADAAVAVIFAMVKSPCRVDDITHIVL